MSSRNLAPLWIERDSRGSVVRTLDGAYFSSGKMLASRLYDLRIRNTLGMSRAARKTLNAVPLKVVVVPVWCDENWIEYKTMLRSGCVLEEPVVIDDVRSLFQYGEAPVGHSPYLTAAVRRLQEEDLHHLTQHLRIVGCDYGNRLEDKKADAISVIVGCKLDPEKQMSSEYRILSRDMEAETGVFPSVAGHNSITRRMLSNIPTITNFVYRE